MQYALQPVTKYTRSTYSALKVLAARLLCVKVLVDVASVTVTCRWGQSLSK